MIRMNSFAVNKIMEMMDEDVVLHCVIVEIEGGINTPKTIHISPIDGPLRGEVFQDYFEIME